jgi:hypothetical protein
MYTVWWYKEFNGRRIHQWPNAARELAPADADAEQGAPPRSRRFGMAQERVDQPTDGFAVRLRVEGLWRIETRARVGLVPREWLS